MKRKTYSTPAKATAVFLLVLLSVLVLLDATALIILSESDAFFDNGVNLRRYVYENTTAKVCEDVLDDYLFYRLRGYDASNQEKYLAERYSPENSNIFFTITDDGGNLLYENYHEESYRYKTVPVERIMFVPENIYNGGLYWHSLSNSVDSAPLVSEDGYTQDSFSFSYEPAVKPSVEPPSSTEETTESAQTADASEETPERKVTLTVTAYVREELTAKDTVYYLLNFVNFMIANRVYLAVFGVLTVILAVVTFIFLLCSAGHHKNAHGEDEISPEALDMVPLDIYAAFVGVVSAVLLFVAVELLVDLSIFSLLSRTVGSIICLVLVELLVLSLILTFATRVKCGHWWRTTVVYLVLRLLYRMARWFFRKIRQIVLGIPALWRYALAFAGVSLVELIILVSTPLETILLWWLLEKLIVAFVGFFVLGDWKKLVKGAKEIADGNAEYRIPLQNMYGDFKRHAVCLNSINDGVQKAVNDRMKSERLKTELITNVSHDLKTPLTSIVNYVDLMKKEDIRPEKAKEYLEVLDRQSKRLQKLTIDLVEASKASTGNIPVNAEKTDVSVFLSQLSGEYAEKLAAKGLELVVGCPEENVAIYADGRLLWRVFDNLMNNICKYAQENTRVYISAAVENEKVVVSFKNVSRYPLNISGDELMERFVRGDASRNTEGSGLGLSIARSLIDLQKGKFEIVVDGDLFKVLITFDRYEENACNE